MAADQIPPGCENPQEGVSELKETSHRWASWLRVAAGALALGLVMLLGLARSLVPAAAGLGTHQQLGLPPCSMRVLLGMRCPACGMTTSWSHWTRGQWWAAAQANAGGLCLAFLALAVFIAAARVTWTGRLPATRTLTALGWAIVATGVVTVVDWLFRVSV
ncbi:hypothetical protein Poly21_29530 [Allorhodopirellula heiligendammensis]|uniref:DUF2752 domain-containing protein n=1 Tax=Allorhodopirellula heiligendammensis TaxID=2714739 RepID=A0A5C6BWA8_9BACT|nr:hypothetical protein Poly21_29530 [Allorhodopirellula heiligendammensis]